MDGIEFLLIFTVGQPTIGAMSGSIISGVGLGRAGSLGRYMNGVDMDGTLLN